MTDYLRNRPFMVITYRFVLEPGQTSHSKDFMKTAQWDPVENMVICDRISHKQMQSAELIIDLLNNKIIKCRDSDLDTTNLVDTMDHRAIQLDGEESSQCGEGYQLD
jgi:hypothetical protein